MYVIAARIYNVVIVHNFMYACHCIFTYMLFVHACTCMNTPSTLPLTSPHTHSTHTHTFSGEEITLLVLPKDDDDLQCVSYHQLCQTSQKCIMFYTTFLSLSPPTPISLSLSLSLSFSHTHTAVPSLHLWCVRKSHDH